LVFGQRIETLGEFAHLILYGIARLDLKPSAGS
jgi:hypothetical protein